MTWKMRATSRQGADPPVRIIPVFSGILEHGGLDHDAVTLAEARQAVRSWQSYNQNWTYELIVSDSAFRPIPRTILEDE